MEKECYLKERDLITWLKESIDADKNLIVGMAADAGAPLLLDKEHTTRIELIRFVGRCKHGGLHLSVRTLYGITIDAYWEESLEKWAVIAQLPDLPPIIDSLLDKGVSGWE